jgi:hypothetical protein
VSDAPKPPLTTTTSILPAMAVLGIAVVTLVVFLVINVIANPTVKRATTTTIPIVVGSLDTQVGSTLLTGCQQAGNPPSDIANALFVPVHTAGTAPTLHPNGGAGDYDCLRSLATTASPGAILKYYGAQLQARGWSLFSQGSSTNSPQSLFQKAGSDTFYWIVGITITARHGDRTDWTYRIYQHSSAI